MSRDGPMVRCSHYQMSSFRPAHGIPWPASGFFYGFNDLVGGFDYRAYLYKQSQQPAYDVTYVEPIRAHHRKCFFNSYSPRDFGSSAENFVQTKNLITESPIVWVSGKFAGHGTCSLGKL